MSEVVEPLRYELRTRILWKVLVSLALGGATYAITELTGQPKIWSLTLSVFTGGIALIVQLLMKFEARLARLEVYTERHSARIGTVVEEGITKISEATELFRLVEVSGVRTDTVTQFVKHASQIEPTAPLLVSRLAQAEIGRVSALLKGLSQDRMVVYEGEDRDWLLALTRHVESTIDATSLTSVDLDGRGFTDNGLWTSDLGKHYLEVQREAVQRGVMIRRVFITLGQPDRVTDELASVCRSQQQIGVDVRVLDRESVPDTLRAWLYDFVLFDETISYEMAAMAGLDTGHPTILETRMELQGERVKARIQRFRLLWESAYRFP